MSATLRPPGRIDPDGTPEAEIEAWVGAWSGDDEGERTTALELLSATIDYAFNCRDQDMAQVAILERAVLEAAAFIEDQPCTCTEDEPCPRCFVLNRWFDRRLER